MNVSEDYDGKIERLNTHPDLLPRAEDMKKLLQENRALIIKALTSKAVPRDSKATIRAISFQVAPRGTVAPQIGIKPRVAPQNSIQPSSGIEIGLSIV